MLLFSFIGMVTGQDKLTALRQKYAKRIRFPPIAELGFCGIATGAAMAGLRPVVDLSTATFSYEAIPQIVNEAAIAYANSGGQTTVPVVFYEIRHSRRRRRAALWQSAVVVLEYFRSASRHAVNAGDARADAHGPASQRDPTIFFAHDRLADDRGAVPDGAYEIPLGQADIKRAGHDLTIIATSIQVPRVRRRRILAQGRHLRRSHRPAHLAAVGHATLLASVKKTGRVLITDESHDNCGVAAGLAAIIADEGFASLRAPIKRVSIPPVPVPTPCRWKISSRRWPQESSRWRGCWCDKNGGNPTESTKHLDVENLVYQLS